jgi:hypothetical protein
LARTLAEDPCCGTASAEIKGLRWLDWSQSEEKPTARIWYLTYEGVPHIEVVALTAPDDPPDSSASTLQIIWKVIRIGMLLRTAYQAYKAIRDFDFPDLPHIG